MTKKTLILIFTFFITFFCFSDSTSDIVPEKISKTDIRIGEKINLIIKIPKLENAKLLWDDMNASDNSCDIISKKDYYKDNNLNLDIDFTFFDSGVYKDFYLTIPVVRQDGEVLYVQTDKYNINVKSVLKKEEIDNINSIEDPTKIELRKEKDQAKFSFSFLPYLKIIIIVIIIIIIAMIIYYLIYKFVMKKKDKKEDEIKLPPYDKFISDLAKINFDINDNRFIVENKLSGLTESLKELIYGEFSLNAPSETTRELIKSLYQINFDNEMITGINKVFQEIDLIKFAKANYDYDNLVKFKNNILKLGETINKIYNDKKDLEEEKNGNLQT